MSGISRRDLFGFGVGAVAAVVMKPAIAKPALIEFEFSDRKIYYIPRITDGWVIWLDNRPPALYRDSDFSHVELT